MLDVSYLRIEAYSEHPEVVDMADLLVESYLSSKTSVWASPFNASEIHHLISLYKNEP